MTGIYSNSVLKKILLIIFSIMIIISLGYIHYTAGNDYDLSLFFLLPVFISTWMTGIWGGIIISFLCAAAGFTGDVFLSGTSGSISIFALNQTFRLIIFLLVTYILSELKRSLNSQKKLAKTDPLTGLFNKRAFYSNAEIELNRSARAARPVSAVYIDLDNFKAVNDTHGHDAGDQLLKGVSRLIRKNIRSFDIPGRLGGDEFIILFADSDSSSALQATEKVMKNLLSLMQEKKWDVTFSMGLITYKKPPAGVDELISEADKVMYAAKKRGKNRIVQKKV